jgi:hypothetical protein
MYRSHKVFCKFDSVNARASDAAPLSPAGAVADFSATEGTTVDERMSTETSFKIMVLLVGDRVACPVCE